MLALFVLIATILFLLFGFGFLILFFKGYNRLAMLCFVLLTMHFVGIYEYQDMRDRAEKLRVSQESLLADLPVYHFLTDAIRNSDPSESAEIDKLRIWVGKFQDGAMTYENTLYNLINKRKALFVRLYTFRSWFDGLQPIELY